MSRPLVLLAALLALAVPAPGAAQSSSERERERERIERERERAQEARERMQEARERTREREEERREREQERRERAREQAGALDTVVAFDARGSVTVSCPGGAVIVTASDKNEIRVKARTEGGAIRFTSSGGRATLEPMSGRGCSDGRFEVTMPAGARLLATTWSGSVSVRGVQGETEIHAQSGDVDVQDAGDRLDVETLSGDVMVKNVKGVAALHTVSGDLQLSGARGEVEIETVSGDLELREITARQVRAQSTSGDVSFAGVIVDAGRYEFNTHSGEVRLELPANVGAQLSVSTFSGGIDSEFPVTLRPGEHGIGSSNARRLNFTLGQGSARILAETFSGDITLTTTARRP